MDLNILRILRVFLIGAGLLLAALWLLTFLMSERIAAQYPPAGRMVPLSGGVIHLVDLKPAGAPRGTILLLHGASGNQADMSVPLAAPLVAAGFRVIAPDRPGHGWSDRFGGSSSPARQAEILRGALAKIGVNEAIVVGHSWAGALASNFAIAHKDFTKGLVLISPVTHPWPGGISWYYTPASTPGFGWLFTNTLTLPAGLLTMPAAIREVFAPQIPPLDFIESTGVRLVLRPAEFRANAEDVAGLYDFVSQQSKHMGEITAPTAIISGDKDTVVYTSIHSVNSARQIPGATLTILPDMGHSPHHSATADVVNTILGVAKRVGW